MDCASRRQHGLRGAPRGGRRDRHRAQQRARVLLPRHDAQRALRADRQPVRARPLGRRQLGRRGQRAGARRRRARARLRRRRLDPHPRLVLRHGRAQADLRPRAARTRRRGLAAADALRPAHAHASPTAAARSPSWPGPIRSTRSACRRSAGTTSAAAREPGDLSGLRVAYSDDLGYIRLDREVRERFAEAVAAFAAATGATVEWAAPRPRLAARRLERDRLRRQQRQRGPAARERPRRRRRARADRGGPGPERRGVRRGAQRRRTRSRPPGRPSTRATTCC